MNSNWLVWVHNNLETLLALVGLGVAAVLLDIKRR